MRRIDDVARFAGDETRYHPVAKALHWLVALLVAVQFCVAWAMPDIGPQTKLGRLINLHLTVGALIGFAAVVRMSWRLRHSAPGAIATEPRWLRTAARVSHGTLYVLLLIVPLARVGRRIGARLARDAFPSPRAAAIAAPRVRGGISGRRCAHVPGLYAVGDCGTACRCSSLPSADLARRGAGADAPGQSIDAWVACRPRGRRMNKGLKSGGKGRERELDQEMSR